MKMENKKTIENLISGKYSEKYNNDIMFKLSVDVLINDYNIETVLRTILLLCTNIEAAENLIKKLKNCENCGNRLFDIKKDIRRCNKCFNQSLWIDKEVL